MNIDIALEKIYSLKQFHVKLGLDNITQLLNYLGNPHKTIKMFHVAGSNGKGSTCSFLASILQENGYKVGLFTSPHFVKFNERIRINGIEISDEEIINFLEENKSYIDKFKPTFFEISTALAFIHFFKMNVDYAVIETGLGGRLDATNVISPIASLITSISFEHSHILGNTLEKIASEKAGIIKDDIPAFLGDLPISAVNEIKDIAESRKSEINILRDSVDISDNKISMKLDNEIHEFSNLGLKGKHQLLNAGLAVKALNSTLGISDPQIIRNGLDNVVKNSRIQGRYERFGKYQNILFDAAHNLEGIEIFLDEFKKEAKRYKEKRLIFGAMKDKDIKRMLKNLTPYFDKIFVTSTKYDRAASAEEIKKIADSENIDVMVTKAPTKIVDNHLKNVEKNNCLVVLGSIYLLGQIKMSLGSEN